MGSLRFEWVVVVGICAAFSVSLHSAALLCAVVAFVLLITDAVRSLLRWLNLPCPVPFLSVFSVALGGTLYNLFFAFAPTEIPLLSSPFLLLVLSFFCGLVRLETVSAKRLWQTAFVLSVIGCLRELLGASAIGGYPFEAFTPLTTFSVNGGIPEIGGMLLAALLLWVTCYGTNTYPSFRRHEAVQVAAVTVVTATMHILLTTRFSPNTLWLFFGYAAFTAVICLLLSYQKVVLWAFLPPFVPFLLPAADGWIRWVFPLICGIAVGVLWRMIEAIFDRLSFAVLPRRFDGAPAFLTVAALGVTAVRTLL